MKRKKVAGANAITWRDDEQYEDCAMRLDLKRHQVRLRALITANRARVIREQFLAGLAPAAKPRGLSNVSSGKLRYFLFATTKTTHGEKCNASVTT